MICNGSPAAYISKKTRIDIPTNIGIMKSNLRKTYFQTDMVVSPYVKAVVN